MVDHTLKSNFTVKFLCSYGGKILPRYPDGKLRYVGGDTRVLSVDRCITFRELMLKVRELCGSSAVSLRCQLPTEDLDDALVSITSDEDLTNLIEEYDRAAPSLKIRAFLFSPKPKISPPSTAKGKSSDRLPSSRSIPAVAAAPTCMMPMGFPVCREKSKLNRCYACVTQQGNAANNMFLVHNGNHWQ
ncbi:protein PAL OF QUIRKY-like [Magnolia sinica]|uniref:protein PAL OF QUIRKY-like n=1 Tax=Magnolia sinica TaxID=86752 RepID=UPI00265B55CC|nr:protein PAL OF QUIRKY-like [Magnolia sinica]